MPRPRLNRPPLTKRIIDAAKPDPIPYKDGGKDRFLWDGLEHGLGLKITPTGKKIFILQKSVNRKLKRITFGAYGDLTLEQARTEARRVNGEIAMGRDPVTEAKTEREAQERQERHEKTVSDLWQRYLVEVVSVENKPRTAVEKRRMWQRRIEPAIGKLKIKDVTDQDAGAIVRAPFQFDEAGRIVKGQGEAANLYRLLHHLFSKALAWGMRPRGEGNPLETVTAPRVERRQRLLTTGEVGALRAALAKSLEDGLEHPSVVTCIQAAVLTGFRISELLQLQWPDIRFGELEIHLTDTKTGFSRRPISSEAVQLFRDVERMPGSSFVFRSVKQPREPLAYATVGQAFRRIRVRAGVENCSLHTLRHWFCTATANFISNPRVGMALTGHKSHAAYMNYIHADRDQARELAEQIGRFAASLGKESNVVHLPSAERKR